MFLPLVDLLKNQQLFNQVLRELTERRILFLKNNPPRIPPLITAEQRAAYNLEFKRKEKEEQLDHQILFNSLYREFKAYKRKLRLNKTLKQSKNQGLKQIIQVISVLSNLLSSLFISGYIRIIVY